MPDLDHTDTRHCHNDAESWGSSTLWTDDFKDSVDNHDSVRDATNPVPTGAHQLVERDPSSGLFEDSSLDQCKRVVSCSNDEPATSLSLKEPMFWLNDYQCSVCGIEMPPSFVEERQEHFDFHLAQKLQEEESSNINRIIKPKKRFIQEDQMSHNRQRKKQKLSPPQGCVYQKSSTNSTSTYIYA